MLNDNFSKKDSRMWGMGLESWNTLMVVFLSIGAAAAAVVGVATYVTLKLQKAETLAAQAEFNAYKLSVAVQVADAMSKGIDAGITAGNAVKESEALKLEVAQANEGAQIANQHAAEANKAAEIERVERLKLELQIAPRRLNAAQQDAFVRACRPFVGRSVSVLTYSLDVEAAIFAKQIIGLLQKAGLSAEDQVASSIPVGGFSLGVHITGPETILVQDLTAAFASVGIVTAAPNSSSADGGFISTESAPTTGVSILVGAKPIQ